MTPKEETKAKPKPDPLKLATGGVVGTGQQLQAPGEAQKGNMLNNYGAKDETEKARDELKAAGIDIKKTTPAPLYMGEDKPAKPTMNKVEDFLNALLPNREVKPLPQSKDHLGDINFTAPVGAGGQGKILDQSPPVEVAPSPGFMQAAKDLPIPTQTIMSNGNPAQVDAAPQKADKGPGDGLKDFGLGLLGILQAATAGRTAGLQDRAFDYSKETILGRNDVRKDEQKQMDWQEKLQALTNTSREAQAKAERDLQERLSQARTEAEVEAAKQQYKNDIGRIKEQGFQARLTQREAVNPTLPGSDSLAIRNTLAATPKGK